MAEYGLGRKDKHPSVDRAIQLYPMRAHPFYTARALPTYKYWYQGSAWIDQGNTGTCVAHAFAHRRADSPIIVDGIDSKYAIDLYLEATGDTSLQQGTWGIKVAERLLARGEITGFYWCENAQQLRTAVLSVGTVAVGTYWYNSMFSPVSRYNNKYLDVITGSGVAGGHEYLVNGINLNPTSGKPFYRIKNSWGTGWGKGGTARIYCEDLERLIFDRDGDACVVAEVKA